MSFGEYLHNFRTNRRRKIPLHEIAKKSGISVGQLSRLETGSRGTPKPDTIRKLASALAIPYEEMLQAAGIIEGDVRPKGQTDLDKKKLLEWIEELRIQNGRRDEKITWYNKALNDVRDAIKDGYCNGRE